MREELAFCATTHKNVGDIASRRSSDGWHLLSEISRLCHPIPRNWSVICLFVKYNVYRSEGKFMQFTAACDRLIKRF